MTVPTAIMRPMLNVQLFTSDEATWRDAARRLHRAMIGGISDVANPTNGTHAEGVVFIGAAQAEAAAIQRALTAGRHVLVVAEPCLTRDSLDALAAAATRKGLVFALVNPDRKLPSRDTVKKQLGGPLGSPELVRIHRWEAHAAAETVSPLGLPGPLVGEMEQAVWLVDRPLLRVFALEQKAMGRDAKDGAANDGRYLQVHLSFDQGMAVIDYDDRLPAGAGYRSLSVIGSSGSAQIDDQANVQLVYGGGLPQGVAVGEGIRHFATLVDDFAAAVETKRDTGRDTVADVETWRTVIAAAAAAEKSLKSHEPTIPEAR